MSASHTFRRHNGKLEISLDFNDLRADRQAGYAISVDPNLGFLLLSDVR